jgi:hypothetical protein
LRRARTLGGVRPASWLSSELAQPRRTRALGDCGGTDAETGERGVVEGKHARLSHVLWRPQARRTRGGFLGEHRRSMLMSVVCAVQFNDPERTVTRMSVSSNCFYDSAGNISHGFDIGRALSLACAAYESRMKRPPPLIAEPSRIAGYPDILQYQYRATDGGKVFTTTAAQYRRDLLFASIFTGGIITSFTGGRFSLEDGYHHPSMGRNGGPPWGASGFLTTETVTVNGDPVPVPGPIVGTGLPAIMLIAVMQVLIFARIRRWRAQ